MVVDFTVPADLRMKLKEKRKTIWTLPENRKLWNMGVRVGSHIWSP